MRKTWKGKLFVTISCVVCFQTATFASDFQLREDFLAALQFDPDYQSAIAQRDAGLEIQEQAKASLRPQSFLNIQRSINDTFSRSMSPIGPIDRNFESYPSYNISLQVRQALYRPKLWAALDQSKFQTLYAELMLLGAQQDLGLRLLNAHAQWSASRHTLEITRETLSIVERLKATSVRQQRAGESTRVDVELAEARVEQARSQLADASNSLNTARFAVMQIIFGPASGEQLRNRRSHDNPMQLPLGLIDRLPMPFDDAKHWREAAYKNSPSIRAYEAALQIALQEYKKATTEHQPTVDLFASKSQASSAMDNTIGTQFRSAAVGIQLNVPVYSGGAIESQIRQAHAQLRRAENDLASTKARVALDIEREFGNLLTARTNANAQRTLLEAFAKSLEAIRRGQSAGIYTQSDEDQVLIQILASKREIIISNARAISAWSRLMANVGQLSVDTAHLLELIALR